MRARPKADMFSSQPIVPGLTELHNHIVGVVKAFAKYIV
jgi:hypothetical protein